MQARDDAIVLSATDLARFLVCQHGTGLDLAVCRGRLDRPPMYADALLEALRKRGDDHERGHVEALRATGVNVVDLRGAADRPAETLAAMRAGADVIVQGAFTDARWLGYPDILQRVGRPSALGSWSYEAYDTKLARETRVGSILQLAVYSDLLAQTQGAAPECFHVVTPDPLDPLHSYRFDDYGAYFRLIRRRLLDVLELGAEIIERDTYPEPVEQCDVCRWWERCEGRRRADDHLAFIAGVTRGQRTELQAHGVGTLAAAAALPLPIPFKPSRGSTETYTRIREQARVQDEQRKTGRAVHELLNVEEGLGLCRLPEPSPGDLFLDLEGARFAREGGREYLFGLGRVVDGGFQYQSWWAYSDAEEQRAFEAAIDAVMAAWADDPAMHLYHFAPYEPTAFKRLAGRYATRERALDQLLRGERFVDLFGIVRQSLRAGVESYSIKALEQYYGYVRDIPLREVSAHKLALELALEGQAPDSITDANRVAVERYNRDDCQSTWRLREWLETLRRDLLDRDVAVPRPVLGDGEASEATTEREQRAEALRARLLQGVSPEASDPAHPQHPRWLLAYLIDWHHREEKADWWDYFRIRDLPEEDLLDEQKAIAGLALVERVDIVRNVRTGRPTGSVVDRYAYPAQELEIRAGHNLKLQDGRRFGDVVALDREARTIDVKKGKGVVDEHPSAAFSCDVVPTLVLQESLGRFAEGLLDHGVDQMAAGVDLLFRRTPRLLGESFDPPPEGSMGDYAHRIAPLLNRTVLPVQGPPGSGKTYVGAEMIRSLVRAGKRVGVSATSHKVIQNVFDAVSEQAAGAGETVRLGRKVKQGEETPGGAAVFLKNDQALAAVKSGTVQVLGGTAWLWADPDLARAVDVLFVDEAGQMSLASVLAIAQAADSVVLLGDPQQLDQPQKGSHPEGVDVSALQHVIGSGKTMPKDRGLFITETWRLAPSICAFTSELFYEGRLKSKAGLEHQRLGGTDGFDGAGLWWVPVDHDGNRNASTEEVDVVASIAQRLLTPGAQWFDDKGEAHPLTAADLRVVAPFNAQVNRLQDRLAAFGVPAGTVDKFQGQTCAVVIYSMATSRPEDAPHGMEFLYSLHRMNVATSRARCAAFIVSSPRLLEPECRTPRQMKLANALCRYVELSGRATAPDGPY